MVLTEVLDLMHRKEVKRSESYIQTHTHLRSLPLLPCAFATNCSPLMEMMILLPPAFLHAFEIGR